MGNFRRRDDTCLKIITQRYLRILAFIGGSTVKVDRESKPTRCGSEAVLLLWQIW